MGASCFLIGHREAGKDVFPVLSEAVERHIAEYGVTDFYVGHYGTFDGLAAQAVREARNQHPEIQLTLVLPYHPAIRPIRIPEGFDGTFYPWADEKIPKRLAIIKTNKRMVDSCDYLITYAYHFLGGTGQIVEYARKREKRGLLHIENVAANLRDTVL